jgi:2-polyprenyl-6-methoxyphenol hydroxylase-like FAD-dependent oxidoreductase
MAWLGDSNHSLSNAERIAIIKDKAATLAEPARSAFSWIPEDTAVQKADISYWVPRPWDVDRRWKGRVTLIGDAAHPMPPCKLLQPCMILTRC